MAPGHHSVKEKVAWGHHESKMSSGPRVHALDKFVLRLPEGMRDKIGAAARANRRTMNAEIVQRLEASFSSPGEPLLVINKNTSEADIIWELPNSMQSLQAEVAELRASLVKAIAEAGVPNSADVIFETWQLVAELLESVKALTKSQSPGDTNKTD